MRLSYYGRLLKKDGKLSLTSDAHRRIYNEFVKSVPEGMYVELFAEIQDADASLAQIAKIHAMIRELSIHVGLSFEAMKLLVKDKAGMCFNTTNAKGDASIVCKSFGELSREDMNLAIKAAEEIGETVGCPLQPRQ